MGSQESATERSDREARDLAMGSQESVIERSDRESRDHADSVHRTCMLALETLEQDARVQRQQEHARLPPAHEVLCHFADILYELPEDWLFFLQIYVTLIVKH